MSDASISIPLGATINMDGAAITITIMTLAAAYMLGIHVDIPTVIILSFLATPGACGASGGAGGSQEGGLMRNPELFWVLFFSR